MISRISQNRDLYCRPPACVTVYLLFPYCCPIVVRGPSLVTIWLYATSGLELWQVHQATRVVRHYYFVSFFTYPYFAYTPPPVHSFKYLNLGNLELGFVRQDQRPNLTPELSGRTYYWKINFLFHFLYYESINLFINH